MNDSSTYDVGIVGGGLAGLSLSIQLAKKGHSVILFEKESYPFHKVCGEYISLESRDFIKSLGLSLDSLSLPGIDTLFLTAPNGKSFTTRLPLGGFGVSRYYLDNELAQIAKQHGVVIKERHKVDDVSYDQLFNIKCGVDAYHVKVCCAAYGKRSNMDIKWKRDFLKKQDQRLDNFVGVKYHIKTDWKENVIGLHNFENGYCGISKIEEDKYCLCYMTRAGNLKQCGNDIKRMEQEVLYTNPYLKKIFSTSSFMPGFPVTISQISFSSKTPVENGILMLGDAAGMITPLCGNGMSIAFHTSKIAFSLIDNYLSGDSSLHELEQHYTKEWNKHFARRLHTGRIIQQFFGKKSLSNLFVGSFKAMPFLAKPIIRRTHGTPF